jgi:hypothetical protein
MSSSLITDLFIASFNADLAALDCAAQVSAATEQHANMIELQDEDGQFLGHFPDDISPATAVAAYSLYGRGLSRGALAGEHAAWAKLRKLIGAASDAD